MFFLKQQIRIEKWFSTFLYRASLRSIAATHYNQRPRIWN